MSNAGREYDLEDRLVTYAASVIALTEALPNTRAGNHIAAHLAQDHRASLIAQRNGPGFCHA